MCFIIDVITGCYCKPTSFPIMFKWQEKKEKDHVPSYVRNKYYMLYTSGIPGLSNQSSNIFSSVKPLSLKIIDMTNKTLRLSQTTSIFFVNKNVLLNYTIASFL